MKKLNEKKKEMAKKMGAGVHPDTLKYMKKNKLGMYSAADKKLTKENTPPNYKKHLDKEYQDEDKFDTRKGE